MQAWKHGQLVQNFTNAKTLGIWIWLVFAHAADPYERNCLINTFKNPLQDSVLVIEPPTKQEKQHTVTEVIAIFPEEVVRALIKEVLKSMKYLVAVHVAQPTVNHHRGPILKILMSVAARTTHNASRSEIILHFVYND